MSAGREGVQTLASHLRDMVKHSYEPPDNHIDLLCQAADALEGLSTLTAELGAMQQLLDHVRNGSVDWHQAETTLARVVAALAASTVPKVRT